jgi:sugar/nucleoside kinase (ribokinase family)
VALRFSEMKQYDIIGVGALAVDDLLFVEEFPVAGEKTRVQRRQRDGGGLAGTALAAGARLGARCSWLGVLGESELARFAREGLEADGVNTSHVVFEAGAEPHYSVIVVEEGSGRRSILACNDGVRPYPLHALTRELIASAHVLFVDHTQIAAGIYAARVARELGVPVVADIERTPDGLEELLPLIDHLILGINAGRMLSGKEIALEVVRALAPGRTCVAVTDGESGCWFSAEGAEVRHIPAYQVPVVDTTGCGDVFHGAYMAELARGTSIEDALRFASAAAAITATRVGGRSGAPTRAEVMSCLDTGGDSS